MQRYGGRSHRVTVRPSQHGPAAGKVQKAAPFHLGGGTGGWGLAANHPHPIYTLPTLLPYLTGRGPVGWHLHHLEAVQLEELGGGRRRGAAHAGQLAVEAEEDLSKGITRQGGGFRASTELHSHIRSTIRTCGVTSTYAELHPPVNSIPSWEKVTLQPAMSSSYYSRPPPQFHPCKLFPHRLTSLHSPPLPPSPPLPGR